MIDHQRKNVGPRLKKIRIHLKMTLQEFYGPIAKHVNNFSPIENGARSIGKRLSEEIIRYYNLNTHFLDTGHGEMLLKANPQQEQQTTSVNYPESKKEGVPYLNVNLSDFSGDRNILNESPEYYVNFRPFNDCDAYLPVFGDSMYPKFASGEIIAIREILHKDIIQWGEAYLIQTDETANSLITIKLLFEHPSSEKIIMRASNPNFRGDTVLQKNAIKKLFMIKGKITRNLL
ncbi:S24 family peptidase [Pedobacter antarcticus]|uniref:S24 family peptidase n=2 Tax=Pedobacter antarcticus TaxID=34086 RepID=UPI00292EB05A|nr:S24 family peptidase [Pedobacter antarcticus]